MCFSKVVNNFSHDLVVAQLKGHFEGKSYMKEIIIGVLTKRIYNSFRDILISNP